MYAGDFNPDEMFYERTDHDLGVRPSDSDSSSDDGRGYHHHHHHHHAPPVRYVYDAVAERTAQRLREAERAAGLGLVNGVH